MWSKTRQILESRLANDLKGRVCYHWDVYRRDGKCRTECHVLSIFVDGTCWFHTDQRFWDVKYGARPEPRDDDIIREFGLVENYWGGIHPPVPERAVHRRGDCTRQLLHPAACRLGRAPWQTPDQGACRQRRERAGVVPQVDPAPHGNAESIS